MKIRIGSVSDGKQLHKLLNESLELNAFDGIETYSLDWVKSVILKKHRNLVLIVEEKEGIIGFLIAHYLLDVKQTILNDLYVKRKYRKRGIATLLLKEFEKRASSKKIKYLTGLVITGNKKMQQFMLKNDYDKGKAFYFFEKRT